MSNSQVECTQQFCDDEDDEDAAATINLVRVAASDGAELKDDTSCVLLPRGSALAIGRTASDGPNNLVLHDPDKRPPVVSAKHALKNREFLASTTQFLDRSSDKETQNRLVKRKV